MNSAALQRIFRQNPYLFTLLLLVIAIAVNAHYQDTFFRARTINGTMRVLLPAMLLAVGQTIVVIGGGIDLSVGTMVSMIGAILVTNIMPDATTDKIILGFAAGIGAGILAGMFNGFCVAYLRLQPIVTTYATSFIFSGIALNILPRPGGNLPRALTNFYRSPQLGIPTAAYVIVLLLLFWIILRSTRYGQYLFATGGKADAAYTTGVPVTMVRFSTYVFSGLFAAFAAIALTLLSGSSAPNAGDNMTLTTIVAVVLGGTRLSGGQGGIAGTLMGVAILTFVSNIMSFARISTWHQDLANATVIIVALAGPGIIRLLRKISQWVIQR